MKTIPLDEDCEMKEFAIRARAYFYEEKSKIGFMRNPSNVFPDPLEITPGELVAIDYPNSNEKENSIIVLRAAEDYDSAKQYTFNKKR